MWETGMSQKALPLAKQLGGTKDGYNLGAIE
jgi:hypothetical protein